MIDVRPRISRRPQTAIAWLALLLAAGPLAAQINNPAYADYFLIGQFGEVCTMCEVTVLCTAGESPPEFERVPEDGSFTLYDLQTRTFWSQVSTIWEWFVTNFKTDALAARGHTRPVHVYPVINGRWAPMQTAEARLILDPGVIELGNKSIDRVDRRWFDAETGTTLGYCQRLPLWDTLEVIERHAAGRENDDA